MSTRSILLVLPFLAAACGPAPDPDEGRGDIAEKELQKQDVTADLTAIDNIARPVPLDPEPVGTPEPTAPLPTPEPTADPVEAWVSPDPSTGYALPYPELCGNGELDSGEECDGDLFAESSTRSCRKYRSRLPQGGRPFNDAPIGNLQCQSDCSVNTTECTVDEDGCEAVTWDDDSQRYTRGPLVLDGSDADTVEAWADCPSIQATQVVFANFDDETIAPLVGGEFLDGDDGVVSSEDEGTWCLASFYTAHGETPIVLDNVNLSNFDFLANAGVLLGSIDVRGGGEKLQQIRLVRGSTVDDYTALCDSEVLYEKWVLAPVLDWTDGAPAHDEICN